MNLRTLNPVTLMDRGTTWLAERNHRALRRGIGRRNAIGLIVGFALYGLTWFVPGLHELVAGMLAGLGLIMLTGIYTHTGYRLGRADGRDDMIRSLGEAQRRGLTLTDFMHGEMVRDLFPHATITDDDGHVVGIMSIPEALRLMNHTDDDEG